MDDAQTSQCAALAARISEEIDGGLFKNVLVEHQATFHDFIIAQETIKKYIQTHDCILYGGTAIDYALRLRGDKIYADTDLPDFDFWSPAHVETAREIINILAALMPHVNVYGTRAKFIRTLRVSVGDNNWVADISYVPRALFDRLPTLVFDGMRIIHPHFQFGDLHSSLAYPYDGAPREAVFSRWKKDISRYGKLLAAYPLLPLAEGTEGAERPRIEPETTQIALPRDIATHSILHGFAAYSVYYNIIAGANAPLNRELAQTRIHGVPLASARMPKISGSDTILIDVPYDLVEILAHRDIIPRYTNAAKPRRFYPLLDLFEASSMCTIGSSPPATLVAYTSFERLANYISVQISPQDSARLRVVGIHGLLKYFIASYLRAKFLSNTITGPVISEQVYLLYYLSCLKLIELSRHTLVAHDFEPPLASFGDSSVPLHDLISMHDNILHIIAPETLAERLTLPPKNIHAPRSNEPPPRPFVYESCPFLRISGEESLAS